MSAVRTFVCVTQRCRCQDLLGFGTGSSDQPSVGTLTSQLEDARKQVSALEAQNAELRGAADPSMRAQVRCVAHVRTRMQFTRVLGYPQLDKVTHEHETMLTKMKTLVERYRAVQVCSHSDGVHGGTCVYNVAPSSGGAFSTAARARRIAEEQSSCGQPGYCSTSAGVGGPYQAGASGCTLYGERQHGSPTWLQHKEETARLKAAGQKAVALARKKGEDLKAAEASRASAQAKLEVRSVYMRVRCYCFLNGRVARRKPNHVSNPCKPSSNAQQVRAPTVVSSNRTRYAPK